MVHLLTTVSSTKYQMKMIVSKGKKEINHRKQKLMQRALGRNSIISGK